MQFTTSFIAGVLSSLIATSVVAAPVGLGRRQIITEADVAPRPPVPGPDAYTSVLPIPQVSQVAAVATTSVYQAPAPPAVATTQVTSTVVGTVTVTSTLALATATSTAAAAPVGFSSSQNVNTNSKGESVLYWGQNGGLTVENNDLTAYCGADSGADIIVLAFLNQFGNGILTPAGTIGQSCSIDTSGSGSNCDELASAIATCRQAGKKILISLGGAIGPYTLTSQQEAETIGQNLWEAYGNSNGNGGVPRPFGKTVVDGWDFDIEIPAGNQFYQYLIAKLRSNFASDPSTKYIISGAPQCPIPEPNMNAIITTAQFDYLWVQFYNNPGCSVNGAINFDGWKSNIANTPSANAKIFVGVPASPLGATGLIAGAIYYLEPNNLVNTVTEHSSDPAFGGIMMWAAGYSDANVVNGCTYVQQAKRILTTGKSC